MPGSHLTCLTDSWLVGLCATWHVIYSWSSIYSHWYKSMDERLLYSNATIQNYILKMNLKSFTVSKKRCPPMTLSRVDSSLPSGIVGRQISRFLLFFFLLEMCALCSRTKEKKGPLTLWFLFFFNFLCLGKPMYFSFFTNTIKNKTKHILCS